jgi:hypothetical protein
MLTGPAARTGVVEDLVHLVPMTPRVSNVTKVRSTCFSSAQAFQVPNGNGSRSHFQLWKTIVAPNVPRKTVLQQ